MAMVFKADSVTNPVNVKKDKSTAPVSIQLQVMALLRGVVYCI